MASSKSESFKLILLHELKLFIVRTPDSKVRRNPFLQVYLGPAREHPLAVKLGRYSSSALYDLLSRRLTKIEKTCPKIFLKRIWS